MRDSIFHGHRHPPTPFQPKGCLLWYCYHRRWPWDLLPGARPSNYDHLGGRRGQISRVPRRPIRSRSAIRTYTPDWFKHAIVCQIFPDRCHGTRMPIRRAASTAEGRRHSDWDDMCPIALQARARATSSIITTFRRRTSRPASGKIAISDWALRIYLNPIFEKFPAITVTGTAVLPRRPHAGTMKFAGFCQAARKASYHRGVFNIPVPTASRASTASATISGVGAYQSEGQPYYECHKHPTTMNREFGAYRTCRTY